MADIFSRKKHSTVMSTIRWRGNAATELRLLALFRAHRITGWRRGASLRRKGEGPRLKAFRVKPDFVFWTHRLAVFVDAASGPAAPSTPRRRKRTPPSGGKKFPLTAPATASLPAPCAPWAGASAASGHTNSPAPTPPASSPASPARSANPTAAPACPPPRPPPSLGIRPWAVGIPPRLRPLVLAPRSRPRSLSRPPARKPPPHCLTTTIGHKKTGG